jgi:alkanesulfonate monooxygenase SsuD/methylene tetrahydromethanopterin reductase-like flavin-dependent oxidoreductase (luciferase family)
MEVSTQFWPWHSTAELLEYAQLAVRSYPYDYVWLCDEYQYEDANTLLTLMASQLDTSVGPLVTFPWRNPLDLAQRFSTIAKVTRPGRHVALGIGIGGTVQIQVLGEKQIPVAMFEETIEFLRAQFAGESAELGRFPLLTARFKYNPTTKAKLYFPPPIAPVPVYVAAGGPKTCAVAGRHGDGVVLSQLVGRTSPPGIKAGLLKEALNWVSDAARGVGRDPTQIKKIYAGHISVSRDGRAARTWAKRNTSYGLAEIYLRDRERLALLDIAEEEVEPIAEAYRHGLGLEVATERVSDSLLRRAGLVIAGTPDECIGPFRELKHDLEVLGFDHLVFGVPLGPNVPEAVELLSKEVLPAVMS